MSNRVVWSIVILVACIVGYFYTQNVILLLKMYSMLSTLELVVRLIAALGPFVIIWEIVHSGNMKDAK
jgi:hypothetical protein